jgi:Ca2+-binding RTX toxin-like protein
VFGRPARRPGAKSRLRLFTFLAALICVLAVSQPAARANHSDGVGHSFTFLQAPYTQDLYATHLPFAVGVGFAPDGDPIVGLGSPWYRIDSQGVEANAHGDELHPVASLGVGSDWVGLVNHPNGSIYSNDSAGVRKHDPNTGVVTAGPFGQGGNTLGIAVDPKTGNLVYVDNQNQVSFVNPDFTTSGKFSTVGGSYDGLYFDPTGEFLFLGQPGGGVLTVLRRDGTFVQNVPIPSGPDGVAFHADTPKFVVTNNIDGTMTRLDFPSDNYTVPPVQTVFASGGFRGDFANVGPDGCLYLSQQFTRFEDDSTSGEGSLVRICSGFAPAPGAGTEGPAGDDTCSDGIDNDGDGFEDQDDPDCQSPEGPPGSFSCEDGVDNDGDGFTDIADSGCQASTGGGACFGVAPTITGSGTVRGTAGDDVIVTGSGNDTVYGLGGNDLICTDGGNDTVYAGMGDDQVNGAAGDDLEFGGKGNDRLFGGGGNDKLRGNLGDDYERGGDGTDQVRGNEDNDKLFGDEGNDTVFGDDGSDRVYGGDGKDKLYGASGNDMAAGSTGNDYLNGGTGRDTCMGGPGNDAAINCESETAIEH